MLSIESIYQSKLEKFYGAAQTQAAKVGTRSGAFQDLLGTIEARMSLYATSESADTQTTGIALTTKNSSAEIEAAVESAARTTGIDADLIRAVIQVESSFRTDAISGCGAQGLMQLMPGTAREMNVEDPFDAYDNVMGGAGYLKKLMNRFGDVRLALAAYNTGQGRIASLGITDADDAEQYSKISSGVRGYVDKVLDYWEQFRSE